MPRPAIAALRSDCPSFTVSQPAVRTWRFSPDGARVLFTSSRSGSSQLWTMPVDGGEPTQLTDFAPGVSDPVWSPDGRWIAVTSEVWPDCGADEDCHAEREEQAAEGKDERPGDDGLDWAEHDLGPPIDGLGVAVRGRHGCGPEPPPQRLGAGEDGVDLSPDWFYQGDIETTYNYCDMCPWKCGITVQSVDGEVIKIDGNVNDPKSRGMLCGRGQAGASFMYDPDRLQSPMIRTGERGEGKFREVSWEEALDYTAEKILAIKDTYGPESLAIFGHTTGDFWFTDYFAQAWGTPNAAKPSSSLCLSPRDEACTLTLGFPVGGHEPMDWDEIECVAFIGSHVGEDARNTVMQDFATMWSKGGKVIVVDPRFSSVAAKADYWLPIKPGTDTALLLAWMNVLINENLYDGAYVDEWTQGFDELAAHVAEFTPDWAAGITDLPAAQIREAAHLMGANLPRSVVIPGRHTTWYGTDAQRMRSTYLVNALLGAYGREGGMYFNKSAYLDDFPLPPWTITGRTRSLASSSWRSFRARQPPCTTGAMISRCEGLNASDRCTGPPSVRISE